MRTRDFLLQHILENQRRIAFKRVAVAAARHDVMERSPVRMGTVRVSRTGRTSEAHRCDGSCSSTALPRHHCGGHAEDACACPSARSGWPPTGVDTTILSDDERATVLEVE
jgi:hypothetical protein